SGRNHNLASPDVLGDPDSRASGVLTAGQSDWYQLTVPVTGRLTAAVTASGASTLIPRLTLARPSGQGLNQSDNAMVQHLPAGTYLLSVSAASGAGDYQLTTDFLQASSQLAAVFRGHLPTGMLADLNSDGIPDLVTASSSIVSVMLGNGD